MKFELIMGDELIRRMNFYTFKQLHIHHTWKPEHKDFTGYNHEKLQNGMRDYHIKTNGWDDIGQHVTLYPDGCFGTGREFGKAPCSIKGWNAGAFSVEMLGSFDIGNDNFAGAQREAILKVAHYFGEKYGYDSVKFHRDNPSAGKTCPGSGIDKDEFIQAAKDCGKPEEAEGTVRFELLGQGLAEIPGVIIDGRTFVQARELLETMGFDVGWDDAGKTVSVKQKAFAL